jgi:peptidoglycan/LPS O-acetylase OafA/YrhL
MRGACILHYRADIDGLRAISIALVVLFHFGLPLPGGFVGVDVFFVISGYLITGILLREIEAGSFSLLSFYDRRIRRIFPALFVVVIATLAVGALVLLPGDYQQAGMSALYSSLSLANFFFLRNTSYFDPAAETMPLLHIWSLAVEEQFYIVWPLLLALLAWLFRNKRQALIWACAMLAVGSLAWSIYLVGENPKAAFYLPHARAWELAFGAILALVPHTVWPRSPAVAQVAGIGGLGLILFGAITLTEDSAFPGGNALFPVVGAALLIAPWNATSLVQRALCLGPLVFLGKISYSLYLWHWPVLVLWKHFIGGESATPAELGALLVVSLILAYASWRWIEQPFRGPFSYSKLVIVRSGIAAASLCAVLSWLVVQNHGFPGRLPSHLQALASKEIMWNYSCGKSVPDGPAKGLCMVGADWSAAKTRAILWGESHAEHLLPLIHLAARRAEVSVALVRSCPPIIRAEGVQRRGDGPRYSEECSRHNAATEALLRASSDIKLVLMSWLQRYDGYYYAGQERLGSHQAALQLVQDSIDDLIPRISAPGRTVLVIGDVPRMPRDPVPCILSEQGLLRRPCKDSFPSLPRATFDANQADVLEAVRAAASRHPQAKAHMLADYMCDEARSLTYLNGEFLYRDTAHLRRNLTPATATAFVELLKLDALLVSAQQPLRRDAAHEAAGVKSDH